MPAAHTRVAIIGCGHVGLACAHSILLNRTAREIVLIDRDHDRARGEALDLQQSVPLGSPVTITAGDYADAAEAQIAILTAGGQSKFSTTRLALLDSERLRNLLGDHFDVDPRSVHATLIGEHGDSSVAVWSSAQIAGVPLARCKGYESLSLPELLAAVRNAGPAVAHLKGNTCYAIAACVTRLADAVLGDHKSALPVCTLLTGQYGFSGIAFSTPCVIGAAGIERVLTLDLAPDEQVALEASANTLREAFASLESA